MSFNKKTIVAIILTLILGGLGSGIWEYLFEPVFKWCLSGMLNIATLGVQSFKDDLYGEIAKGFHEESSLSLTNAIFYWVGCGVAFALFLFARKTKDMVSDISNTNLELDELEAMANGNKKLEESKADINTRISQLRERNLYYAPKAFFLNKLSYFFFAIGIFFYGWMVIGVVKSSYINSGIVYYEQSLSIVAPLITSKELLILQSRFARINSKEDFKSLMFDIAKIGKIDQFELPEFEVW